MRELHTGLRFYSILPLFCVLFTSFILSGCVSSGGYNTQPWTGSNQPSGQNAAQTPNDLSIIAVEQQRLGAPNQAQPNGLPPVKVAILLPLSGQHSKLGQAMLNAAQIALFDVGYDNFELLPKDTKGTPEGARNAARSALQDGAKLVLGPVFSTSVKAARQVTQSANINMIAFSTDWQLANSHTFLIGFLPFDQVERVVRYASNAGYNRIGVLSPRDSYGNGVVAAYQSVARRAGIETSRIERFAPQGHDLGTIMKSFSDYDARRASKNAHGTPFNAVLMPVGSTIARQVGSFLDHYDLPASQVKRLGTGLMDDPALARDKSMDGAWFAAPAPTARLKFERRYNSIYYAKPPRIASLAYDATALAASLARIGLKYDNRPAYNRRAITNPNGFSGVDGIFRFRSDGIVERGLAILEYRNGSIVVIDKAPKTFQRQAY
ncbi:MAG: penicillin-binding protein activator [Alphaproteobacteria bacterium]|nr:MAG: penicillin-binding protein activator [Alphaproteobacteria bacterium]